MRENEKIFLELVHKGIYKIYKNGKIYALMISHKEWKGEYKKRNIPKLKNYKTDKGYIRFTFKDKKQIFAHRVVWMYFNGDIPEGLEPNHKNGIKDDNRLSNLELVTKSEQMIHAVNILKRKVGNKTSGKERKGGCFKLNKKKVLAIRAKLKKGISQTKIAKEYNVTEENIGYINRRVTWKFI
ncbi:hypothetical protein LCGC14_2935610 [marine sediment metagenome]|uniref:HNH nuclease domain-containing protein n=1 Tax=marine sediment metagenome TaxID=412755 RepID=A0A0F8ZS70_9ZZZZ